MSNIKFVDFQYMKNFADEVYKEKYKNECKRYDELNQKFKIYQSHAEKLIYSLMEHPRADYIHWPASERRKELSELMDVLNQNGPDIL